MVQRRPRDFAPFAIKSRGEVKGLRCTDGFHHGLEFVGREFPLARLDPRKNRRAPGDLSRQFCLLESRRLTHLSEPAAEFLLSYRLGCFHSVHLDLAVALFQQRCNNLAKTLLHEVYGVISLCFLGLSTKT